MHLSIVTLILIACSWLCTTMVALVSWIVWTRSGCTCYDLHYCEVFKMRERDHAQMKMKSWTVTRVIEASKDWVFCLTFHPSIQHDDADAVHRRTLRSPDVTLLNHAVWYGLSGFAFKMSRTHACLQNVRPCTTHLKPSPVQNLIGLGQQCS